MISVKETAGILQRLQREPNAIYNHLKIGRRWRLSGLQLIISPPLTMADAAEARIRNGLYAEGHYDQVVAVLREEKDKVVQETRTLSIQPDGTSVEATICHELMHDIFYAVFTALDRSEYYSAVKDALATKYCNISKSGFWDALRSGAIDPEKEYLTGFYHVYEPRCNPLSADVLTRNAFAAELFAYMGIEFLGYPAGISVVRPGWVIGKIPFQLIAYFRRHNLSCLSDNNWQQAIDLRGGLKDARNVEESIHLKRQLDHLYNRPLLFDETS